MTRTTWQKGKETSLIFNPHPSVPYSSNFPYKFPSRLHLQSVVSIHFWSWSSRDVGREMIGPTIFSGDLLTEATRQHSVYQWY